MQYGVIFIASAIKHIAIIIAHYTKLLGEYSKIYKFMEHFRTLFVII